MPAISFSDGNALYDITPVENIFIFEYMANVPGDYVKVYLLGLTMCYNPDEDYSLAKMGKALSLSEDEIKEAYTYWAQIGLVDITSRRPFTVKYHNIKKENSKKIQGNKKYLYTHQPLILELQRIFGGTRILGPSETNYIVVWADEWKVAPEIISLVAAWCVELKGKKVRFSYINKMLGDIYDSDLQSFQQVESYIKNEGAKRTGAAAILNYWNLGRVPTVDEMNLYQKWIKKYKFSKEIIRETQRNMTGINNPSFKALNTILEKLYNNGVQNFTDARKYFKVHDQLKNEAREVYSILGGLRVTEGRIKLYESWLLMGFSHRSVIKAAEALAKTGDRQPDDLDSVLQRWNKNGIVSDKDVAEYMHQIEQTSKKVSELLEEWNESRAPRKHELAIYNTWVQKKYPNELIELACAKSANVKNRMAYANKILSVWEEKGIKTALQAEKEKVAAAAPDIKKETEIPEDDYFSIHSSWEEI